jgi:hypothetical protein
MNSQGEHPTHAKWRKFTNEDLAKLLNNSDDAKLNGDMFFFTGEECDNGHIAVRYSSCANCVMCAQESRDKLKSIKKSNLDSPKTIEAFGIKRTVSHC